MVELIDLPSATSTLTDISEYASPFFLSFWDIMVVPLGILVGIGAIVIIIKAVTKAFHH